MEILIALFIWGLLIMVTDTMATVRGRHRGWTLAGSILIGPITIMVALGIMGDK
jgi:uncharacterized membrane protein